MARTHITPATSELEPTLAKLEQQHSCSGNPAEAWQGILICLEAQLELPDWLRSYLIGAARRLDALRKSASQGGRLPQVATKVGVALGFHAHAGRANDFSRAELFLRNQQISAALAKKIHAGVKLDAAYTEVAADFGVSRSTIVKVWHRSKQKT